MSESQKLIELAERCEAATGPDRELDAAIALLYGWTVHKGDNWIGPHGQISVPEFTGSLDAALTLVPEGQGCTIVQNIGGFPHRATVWTAKGAVGDIQGQPGATPALALSAAALRARAAIA